MTTPPMFNDLNDEFEVIYVDIDIKYDLFKQTRIFQNVKANIDMLNNNHEIQVYIRRSSHNNVHLKVITLLHTRFTFTEMMVIRSLLHDDPYRVLLDLRRIYLQGSAEVNRIFSAKNGNKVSEWITWEEYCAANE